MFVNYNNLIGLVKGKAIPRPLSGTLSGHAAGEPFDKHVYQIIKNEYSNETFRQFEYLNTLYTKNLSARDLAARNSLIESPTVLFLLSRGKNATDKWSIENPFEEKQNDTADILVVKDGKFEIIDIKSKNIDKKAQPPNIISAYKLAQLCAKMLDNADYDSFTINYFGIDWELRDSELVCTDAYHLNLFKTSPSNLYINWAAAMQIQFDVSSLAQDFNKDMHAWAISYLEHFVAQAKKRSKDMIEKFVKPFEKYLKCL